MVCFFFFKQKTAYEMRISDWSSDVCSSDLGAYTQSRPRHNISWALLVPTPPPTNSITLLENDCRDPKPDQRTSTVSISPVPVWVTCIGRQLAGTLNIAPCRGFS